MNLCIVILILKMEENKQHFPHTVLYYFKKGKNATETQRKIRAGCGEGAAIPCRTCQKWFAKSRAGDFSLDDAPPSGRPIETDSDQIETLIENNQYSATREIANILRRSKPRDENHLHWRSYVNCFDV